MTYDIKNKIHPNFEELIFTKYGFNWVTFMSRLDELTGTK